MAKKQPEPKGLIFLDWNPAESVKLMPDAMLNEQILTAAQVLSTVHHYYGCSDEFAQRICTPTHTGHPHAEWVKEAENNYKWVLVLFYKGLVEHKFRTKKVHPTAAMSPYLYNRPADIPLGDTTHPPQLIPAKFQVEEDAVRAYRAYCRSIRQATDVWTRRPVPTWYTKKGRS